MAGTFGRRMIGKRSCATVRAPFPGAGKDDHATAMNGCRAFYSGCFCKRMGSPLLLAVIHVAAFWPVWKWLYWRLTVCPNESYELLPLAAVPTLFLFRLQRQGWRVAPVMGNKLWLGALCFTLLYCAAYPYLPDLFRSALAFSALAFALSALLGGKPDFGLWGLLLLTLQLHNGLQFYLGYPLRAGIAAIAAPLLRVTGFSAVAEGACLNWDGRLVLIDAPCSGVKMLWAGLFLVFVLLSAQRLSWRRTVVLPAGAAAFVLAANLLRATSLFYLESGILDVPAFFHVLTGIVSFAFACAGILWLAERLKRRETCGLHGSS
jgi:exosortase/archaeosortase family protein